MQYVIWLSLFGLFATQALGQRGGGYSGFGRGGMGHGGFPGGLPRDSFGRAGMVQGGGFGFPSRNFATNFGIPPVGPIPPLGVSAFGNQFGFGRRFFPSSAFFTSGFPLFLGGFEYGYPPASNIIIMEEPPPPQVIVQQVPRETVRAEIHEYRPTAPTETVSGEEQPAFTIVLRDGSMRPAVAVSVQDDVLHYVDPDGEHRRLPLDTVDREATRRVNRERKLELRLPSPTPK